MERGWWYRATTAERLAQIDGCIELGMTAKQCAMNCGAPGRVWVQQFATNHGRSFGWDHYRSKMKGAKIGIAHSKANALKATKDAYLAGEPVDFWSVE